MGRKKSEDEDKIEQLEDQVRTLKSINKALIRRLKKLDKKFTYDELEDTETQTKFEVDKPRIKLMVCPFCKKNELEVFEIVGRKIGKCNNCGKRTKAEKT
jgi:hypothetical protein